MRGDFTRNTFDPNQPYSSVRKQQGRVQVDADWNEQVQIQWHQDRTTRRDILGGSGTPVLADGDTPGFRIRVSDDQTNLVVEGGHYYVDGILVQNPESVVVFAPSGGEALPRQPYLMEAPGDTRTIEPGVHLVYLHVFERLITFLEDGNIREVALGGPDHGARTLTVWQVDLMYVDDALVTPGEGDGTTSGTLPQAPCDLDIPAWTDLVAPAQAQLAARAIPGEDSDDDCIVPPAARYRGTENQLYRVEVLTSGDAGVATFVWSRENGSVAASWQSSQANVLTIARNTTDQVLGFANDDYIELVADNIALTDSNVRPPNRVLVQIASITDDQLTVRTVESGLGGTVTNDDVNIANYGPNPIVRRWDGDGATTIPADGSWLELEDGVQVQFPQGPFVAGQHWLIPARTATRDVEWPTTTTGDPRSEGPHGVEHLYTRLAFVQVADDGRMTLLTDCRTPFSDIADSTRRTLHYLGGDGLVHTVNAPTGELRAGVFVGTRPQPDVMVRFEVVDTTDARLGLTETSVTGPLVMDVPTDSDGVASVWPTVTATTVDTLLVRASLLDAGGNARPPYIHYRSDAGSGGGTAPTPTGSPVQGVALLDANGAQVAEINQALQEILWSDIALTMSTILPDGVPPEELGHPTIEVRLGIPRNLAQAPVPGLHWLRLDGDRSSDLPQWVPAQSVIDWVNNTADPTTLFGRDRLPLQLLLRGNFQWASEARGLDPVPRSRVGDICLEVVVVMPSVDPVLEFGGQAVETTVEAAPTLGNLTEGMRVRIEPDVAQALFGANADAATAVRYDAERREYQLVNRSGATVPLQWSSSAGAYVAVAGGAQRPAFGVAERRPLALRVTGLPRIAG